MKTIFWFIKTSIELDISFFKHCNFNLYKKITFITHKYSLLLKHIFTPFNFGGSYVNLWGKKLYYDSKYGIAGYQRVLSTHKRLLQSENIKNVSFVFDVGANVGYFSLMISDLYPKANLYCFEPIPKIYKNLKNNLSDKKRIKMFNNAISDRQGRYKMFFNNKNSAESFLDPKGDIPVLTTTLDSFVLKNKVRRIDILKIDTEGNEFKVLKKAANTLSITRYLFIEISVENNKDYSISQLMSLLYTKKYNYQLRSFRHFSDVSEGKATVFDCLFENIYFKKLNG